MTALPNLSQINSTITSHLNTLARTQPPDFLLCFQELIRRADSPLLSLTTTLWMLPGYLQLLRVRLTLSILMYAL